MEAQITELTALQDAERLQASYGGRLGHLIELGIDWKIGAFAACEVFVSTMGVIYGIGGDADETSTQLCSRLHAEVWPDRAASTRRWR